MDTSTFVRWAAMVLLPLINHSLASTLYGNYNMDDDGIGSSQIDVKITHFGGLSGKCQYKVLGRGVDDAFVDDCPQDVQKYVQINIDNYYAYLYPNHDPLSLYTDTFGTLVIIKGPGCRLRNYQTTSGQVTSTESIMGAEVCDRIKKKLADTMEELDEYWEKWEINFQRKMNKLPPAEIIFDPLKDQPPMASLYAGLPEAVTTSSGAVNSVAIPQAQASSLSPQPLTQSLSPQPLTPSLPTQPIATTNNGGPTILGLNSIRSNNENVMDGDYIKQSSNENHNSYGCTLEKCVTGNGVHDCFTIPCPKDTPPSIALKGFLLFGHPSVHPFSYFSDERSTLYLFERGWCTKKTYTTKNMVTTSEAQVISSAACAQVKERMESNIKRRGLTITANGISTNGMSWNLGFSDDRPPATSAGAGVLAPQALTPTTNPGTQDIKSKQIKLSTTFPKTSNGQCQVEISVVGKGVEDMFTEACSDKPADSVSTDKVFIFGDPKKNTFSLYSNEPNILYVIKNKICAKMTYTTRNGVTKSSRTPLKLGDCNKIKKTITDFLASQQSKPSPPVAAPSFSQPPSPGATPAVSTIPADLQQFKPTYPFTLDNQGSNSKYEMKSSMYFDMYDVEGVNYYVTAKGKGINDHFQVSYNNEVLKAVSATDFMLFGTPTSTLGLFSDTPSTLIIMARGTCYKKTYGPTPTGPSLMSGPECEEVKRRMLARLAVNGNDQAGSSNVGSFNIGNNNINGQSSSPISIPVAAPSLSQPPLLGATPAVSTSPADLQQFKPTYPFTLDDEGANSNYLLNVGQITDSFNVRGCNYYITAKGKGIKDHFQVPCYKKTTTAISAKDFMLFGLPTSTLGLFSDTPSTLIIMTQGTCYKKTYGQNPTGPSLMGGAECEDAKRRMLARSDIRGKVVTQVKILSGDNTNSMTETTGGDTASPEESTSPNNNYNTHSYQGVSPQIQAPTNPLFNGFPFGAMGQVNQFNSHLPSLVSPQPVVTGYDPAPAATSSTTPGVTWREGVYGRIYSSTFYVNKENIGGGQCTIEVIGRGVNELIKDSCYVLGEDLQRFDTGYSLAVADPAKQSGLYTEDWGELVFVRDGSCFKKTYETEWGEQTQIKTEAMSSSQCDRVKECISSALGFTFGQTPGTSPDSFPAWRPGNYNRILNGNLAVNINKNNNGPNGCTMTITLIGRGVNDEIKGTCSEMGTNIKKKTTSYSLAVADPSTSSGIYTEDWSSLVVIKNGECTKRKYESSVINNNTKITSSPLGKVQCDKAKKKISGMLGANFGQH